MHLARGAKGRRISAGSGVFALVFRAFRTTAAPSPWSGAFWEAHPLPSRHARVFISSADWMERNMDWRVETLVPIHNATVHAQILDQIMVINLKDSLQSWELGSEGKWRRV